MCVTKSEVGLLCPLINLQCLQLTLMAPSEPSGTSKFLSIAAMMAVHKSIVSCLCHQMSLSTNCNKYPVKSLSGRYEIWRMSSLLKNSTQVYRIPDKGNYTAWLMFSQQCPIIHATLIRILFRVPWLPITTAFYYYYAGFTSDFLGSWQQKTSAPNQLLITGFVLLKVWIILPFPVSSLQWFCWLLHVMPLCLITT